MRAAAVFGVILTAIVLYAGDDMVGTGMRTAFIRNGLLQTDASDADFETLLFAEMRRVWNRF